MRIGNGKLHLSRGILARFSFAVVLGVVLAGPGCGRSKADRLSEARAALAAADSSGASLYASELFEEAAQMLARAEEERRLGRHDDARDLAGECRRLSRRAAREAEDNRARARGAAMVSLRRLEDAVERANEAVSNMMLGVTPPELAQARADLEHLEQLLGNVRKAIERGFYLDAREMAESAESEAVSIEEGAKVAANVGGGRDPSSL